MAYEQWYAFQSVRLTLASSACITSYISLTDVIATERPTDAYMFYRFGSPTTEFTSSASGPMPMLTKCQLELQELKTVIFNYKTYFFAKAIYSKMSLVHFRTLC